MTANVAHDFVPSKIDLHLRARRIKVLLEHVTFAPPFEVIRTSKLHSRWALYFMYSPTGEVFDQHKYTINQLKSSGFQVLVVVATLSKSYYLLDGLKIADAVIIKKPAGFDFSGYTIGLEYLVKRFGQIDVLVLNDSVFGPFNDLMPLMDDTPWRLTGFTSSYAIENHIQSYAFLIKALDKSMLRSLRSVFFQHIALNFHSAVAFLQETRLARCASKISSVGALWSPPDPLTDLTMAMPMELVSHGFPFLKRSLLGKFSCYFSRDEVLTVLQEKKHPISAEKLFEGFRLN